MCLWGSLVMPFIKCFLSTQGFTYGLSLGSQSEEVEIAISPILQKGKLRLGKLKEVAQDHRAGKWQSQKRVLLRHRGRPSLGEAS